MVVRFGLSLAGGLFVICLWLEVTPERLRLPKRIVMVGGGYIASEFPTSRHARELR